MMAPRPVPRDGDGRQILGARARAGTDTMRERSAEVAQIFGQPAYYLVFAIYPGDAPGEVEITCDEFVHPQVPAETARALRTHLVAPRLEAEAMALRREAEFGVPRVVGAAEAMRKGQPS